ncbi:MAG: phosphoglycerate dehydrogenase [Lachnospiraceae bacterium]
MAKIKCLNPIAQVGLDLLTDDYTITDDFNEAEAVLVRSASMLEMDFPSSLCAIARAGAGVNNIPLERCSEKGIVVFNTPGANANGVKELVIAGMLLAARDIIGGVNWIQSIKDDSEIAKLTEKGKKSFSGTEIGGKKLGVIGLGAIGYRVANAAIDLGMDVYGYNPDIPVEYAWSLSQNVKRVTNLDDLFAICDYITIHVPLNGGTRGMLNKDAFSKMKDGVIILNFARDILVNEEDMAEALNTKKVRKYVTDFPNPTIASMPGCIVIPHLGASTEESEDNCAVMAVEQIKDYIECGNIRNSVNYPACNLGIPDKAVRVCIFHRNVPNMISRFTALLGGAGLNICDMVSKSRGNYSYAMFDLDHPVNTDFKSQVEQLDGVLKVRIIK